MPTLSLEAATAGYREAVRAYEIASARALRDLDASNAADRVAGESEAARAAAADALRGATQKLHAATAATL